MNIENREDIMADLMQALPTPNARVIMTKILEQVPTEKLAEAYAVFLPKVIKDQGIKPTFEPVVDEMAEL